MGGIKEGCLKWIVLEKDVNWTIKKGVIAKFKFRPLEFFLANLVVRSVALAGSTKFKFAAGFIVRKF